MNGTLYHGGVSVTSRNSRVDQVRSNRKMHMAVDNLATVTILRPRASQLAAHVEPHEAHETPAQADHVMMIE